MDSSANDVFRRLGRELQNKVLGQPALVERLLTAVLADGHVLLEGPPGLAKTRAAHLLANAFDATFQRVQFTPDLLPADLTGTSVYDAGAHRFDFYPGPLFHEFVLADEVNRAPAKVQAALLEAMEERQITVAGETRTLGDPFVVVATQNPIEEEGTYELPAAQLDRFALRVVVDYPDRDTERAILDTIPAERRLSPARLPLSADAARIDKATLQAARDAVLDVHLSAPVKDYIVRLVDATRRRRTADSGPDPGSRADTDTDTDIKSETKPRTWTRIRTRTDLLRFIRHPVSPRGTLALARLAQARAWLEGRDHVLPEDVQALAVDVLAHRIGLTYRAEADGIDSRAVIARLLERVVVI